MLLPMWIGYFAKRGAPRLPYMGMKIFFGTKRGARFSCNARDGRTARLRDYEPTRPPRPTWPGPFVRPYISGSKWARQIGRQAGGGREREEEEGWCKKCSFPLSLPRWVSRY